MKTYRDGFIDSDYRTIVTSEGVEHLEYPRLVLAMEKIGGAIMKIGHAAVMQMTMLRYLINKVDYSYEPKSMTSRTVGAICVGVCTYLFASKSPELIPVASEVVEAQFDAYVTKPIARLFNPSYWL